MKLAVMASVGGILYFSDGKIHNEILKDQSHVDKWLNDLMLRYFQHARHAFWEIKSFENEDTNNSKLLDF